MTVSPDPRGRIRGWKPSVLPRLFAARVALLLASWLVVDLAIVHTCAFDQAPHPTAPSAGPVLAGMAPGHDDAAAPQPDHCSCPCHGRSSEPGAAIQFLAPCTIAEDAQVAGSGHLRWAARVLDHPPHLTS